MIIKKSIITLFIFCCFTYESKSTTYYFSNSLGNDNFSFVQAQNKDTPWKSLLKFESLNLFLQPGDSVLFKRGDTFVGTLDIKTSGTYEQPIVFASYGTGTNPVITSMVSLSNWTIYKDKIFYAPLEVPTLNLILLDGRIQHMGRYPNAGFLYYQSNDKNMGISDKHLDGQNWAGSEIVIRKNRWILDRHLVIEHTGHTLKYDTLANYGNNNQYTPIMGNGYFIQGHLETLDQPGEWYYDKGEKRLYMFFEEDVFNGSSVKASTRETNLTIISQQGLKFDSLDFEGGNINGGKIIDSSHITFQDCNFYNQGGNAIYGIKVSHLNISGGTIRDVLNNGIWVEDKGSFITVSGVTTSNVGRIAGAGRSGDGAQEGIAINGSNTTIRDCQIMNTGYNGINFSGSGAWIENNYVKDFCTIKDDGGGIYSYRSHGGTVKGNVIINAVGSYEGAESAYWEPFGKAAGIYLDYGGQDHNAKIIGNTIAHGGWAGIFISNNGGNTITDNIVFDFAQQFFIAAYERDKIRNMVVKDNQFIAKKANQTVLFTQMFHKENISYLGNIDSNYYARPINDFLTIRISEDGKNSHEISLEQWKKHSSLDRNSKKSSLRITNLDDLRFEYNASSKSKTIILDTPYSDITGKQYFNSITLTPYSSVVLIKNQEGRKAL